MDPKTWSKSVDYRTASGMIQPVSSAEEALRCLMDDWPTGEKLKTKTAVRLCLDAIAGECPAEDARRAFVEACREAEQVAQLRQHE